MANDFLSRLLVRLLRGRMGEVRARQELHNLRGVLRFTALFAATVILPAVLLAYLALGSLQAEDTAIDVELEERADQAAEQVVRELRARFDHFESTTRGRLVRQNSPLTGLAELSPHLRAAFRFDRQGQLAAPFVLPEPLPPLQPNPRYVSLVEEAMALEHQGEPLEAAALYRRAAALADSDSRAGQASYAQARCLNAAGLTYEAKRALEDIYSEYANERDAYGFRLGDLAKSRLAEIRFDKDKEDGAIAFRFLVEEELLKSEWTIGYPGEAAVARRALDKIQNHVDADWLGRTRTQLDQLTVQLFWASLLQEEVELFAGTTLRQNQGQFDYQPRAESSSLWATLWWGEDLYAFSFDQAEVLLELNQTIAATDALDDDLTLRLLGTREQPLPSNLVTKSLSPYLPFTLEVAPTSPEELAQKKSRQRRIRLAILLLLISTTAVGVVLTAMMVGRELEGARMKADFAANVSHELRSPITQIRIKAEALLLDLVFDDEDRHAHHAAIVRETERLSRLIDNILDFSAIERGAKRYTFRPQDLGEIVFNAVEAARSNLESSGVEVELDIPYDLPVIWLDREAVSQVITNLLSNAAKYGADGKWIGVFVRVAVDGVDVVVKDRGMGIEPEDQAKIFDHFYRSGDSRVRRRRGTGIGLSIVRYIVEAHGGTISVESAPGQGASFTVTFPLEPPEGTGA